MILVIDNYDSFVFNLARYLRRLTGLETAIIRNDQVSFKDIDDMAPRIIVISPGPCTPAESGMSLDVIRRFGGMIPILGVCLGHQAIVEAMGGKIVRSKRPVHGQSSTIHHDGDALFAGVSNPFKAGRYHSLIADTETIPDSLRSIAWTSDQTVMAVRHVELPIFGLQFHPESVLTDFGYQILFNLLDLIGVPATLPPVREVEENNVGNESGEPTKFRIPGLVPMCFHEDGDRDS